MAAALPAARFRLFLVKKAIRDRGLWCTDVLSDERCFVTDRALSRTAEINMALGVRSLDVCGMTVLTGMMCPIDQEVLEHMYEPLSRAMAAGDTHAIAATITRAAFRIGTTADVRNEFLSESAG